MYRKTWYHMKYSAEYHVFPASFQVISRKVDYLWDSVFSAFCIFCKKLTTSASVFWYFSQYLSKYKRTVQSVRQSILKTVAYWCKFRGDGLRRVCTIMYSRPQAGLKRKRREARKKHIIAFPLRNLKSMTPASPLCLSEAHCTWSRHTLARFGNSLFRTFALRSFTLFALYKKSDKSDSHFEKTESHFSSQKTSDSHEKQKS